MDDDRAPPSPKGLREAHRRGGVDLALALALAALTLWHLLPGVAATPFHRDEARWINHVVYLRQWRHPLGARWQDEGYTAPYGTVDERNRMRDQPPMSSYVLGVGLLLQGRDLTTNHYWIMTGSVAWNRAHGNMPARADLRAARRTDVAIAVLTVIAVYAIGRRLTNRAGGAAGALVLAVHPLTRDTATRAWSDPLLGLLLALAAIAAFRLADRPTWGRAAVLGAFLGLGGATKLSPLALATGLAGYGAVLLIARRFRRPAKGPDGRDTLALGLIAAPLIAFAVFVASYPYLWPNPISHTYRMFAYRAESFDAQARNVPSAAVPNRTDAFRRVGDELGHRYSVAGDLASWLGRRLGVRVGGRGGVGGMDLALAIVGAELLLAAVVRRGLRSGHALVAAVLGGAAALVVLSMGVEYARYLYPVLLFETVCLGIAAGTAWDLLSGWVGRGRRSRTACVTNPAT